MAEGDNRLLQDYALPQASGITSSIVSHAVEANNFELSPTLNFFYGAGAIRWTPLRKPQCAPSSVPCKVQHHQTQQGVHRCH